MVKIGEHGWWNLLAFGGSSFSDKAMTSDRCWLEVAMLGVCRSIKQIILLYESSFLGFGWAVVDHDSPNFNSCFMLFLRPTVYPIFRHSCASTFEVWRHSLGFFWLQGDRSKKRRATQDVHLTDPRIIQDIQVMIINGFPNMAFSMEVSVYCI